MMHSNIPSAQTLVLYFKSKGIKNIVISPGSRNAPLTLSFTKNPFFSCFSIVDERCAAFFALGMAQQLGEPVAVVCTSGSAMLNFYPAVTEAFYSDIPLVVVSADRPKHKIDIGDGQTIRQENIFEKHIGYSANLKEDVSRGLEVTGVERSQASIQSHNQRAIETALKIAFEKSTPVHINIPFEEPLYGLTDRLKVEIPVSETPVAKSGNNDWADLISIWNSSQRKMVLIGVNPPNALEKEILETLARDTSVLVFTETTSNVHHPNFFPSIDSIIAPIEKSVDRDELFDNLQPDLLITLGGLIVSKKIKAFLRGHQPKHHWHIDSNKAYDTFFCLSEHIKTHPNTFFGSVMGDFNKAESSYRDKWLNAKTNYEQKRQTYLEQIGFSDFVAFDLIQPSIPKGYQVHLANSSTVRYTQLFPMDASLHVYCNRGTSGIDGSTSTALGASIHNQKPTLLITGDLSFFYDSNGLWNNYIRPDFRIILINNSGGGIFRILPGFEETDEFSTFFETQHAHSAEHLARMFHFDHLAAANEQEVKMAMSKFYDPSEKPKILEIQTPTAANNKILLDYFDFIS
ncbi:2-succinyl-5-enolpyruvyl-6-hydroxy-3-cyclohexene-1-carboxylic-acid synthase [Flagellimonas myxillae]|uniref:2-succinyl-5-enolpyruvyl-6-hydroxy-3- cyclohexene-1-carboxylic-acid synthase n=1 Tax=Flagellimonas myxillae TaxID=2942214 RepID=UPI00201F7B4F|nr:2-succinyl-5-enolpyruvyl-6-hydroxy-3-cyclohexene-1-carboxylic-acid synthase [Muricauda myxillae]MCL6266138.1 2-succinyl-5-enolpyruvyl-6-hydroxy-3-cyclohexene-1-carboxylic-acid synthase [Muricauda myxillae]